MAKIMKKDANGSWLLKIHLLVSLFTKPWHFIFKKYMIWFFWGTTISKLWVTFLFHFGRLTIKSLFPRKLILISLEVVNYLMEAEAIYVIKLMHLITYFNNFPLRIIQYQHLKHSKANRLFKMLCFCKTSYNVRFWSFMRILNLKIDKIRKQNIFSFKITKQKIFLSVFQN